MAPDLVETVLKLVLGAFIAVVAYFARETASDLKDVTKIVHQHDAKLAVHDERMANLKAELNEITRGRTT